MNKIINILGEVNKKGKFEISSDKTIKDILNEYAGGMKKGKNVKLVQIGGPLGVCVTGKELNKKNVPSLYTSRHHLPKIFNHICVSTYRDQAIVKIH